MSNAKRQRLMQAEHSLWVTSYDIETVETILEAVRGVVGPGGFKGRVVSTVVERKPNEVLIAWELTAGGGAIIPCLWFTTEVAHDQDGTTVELEVVRAKFMTHFFVVTSMTGASKLHSFKSLLTQELDR